MTPDHDKPRLRRYVLGALSDEECAAIEQRYFVDADALAQVSAAEDELIEDYLEERLDPQEREPFERHYLSTPGHRTRVAVARGLMTIAARAGVSPLTPEPSGGVSGESSESASRAGATEPRPGDRPGTHRGRTSSHGRRSSVGRGWGIWRSWFGTTGWPPFQQAVLAASVALVLGAGAVWLFDLRQDARQVQDIPPASTPSSTPPSTPSAGSLPAAGSPAVPGSGAAPGSGATPPGEVAGGRTPAPDTPSSAPGDRDRLAGGTAPPPRPGQASPGTTSNGTTSPGTTAGAAPSSAARAPLIVALSLSPINVRSAGADPTVTIPADAETLELRLEGEAGGPALGRGRALVRTVAGEELWRGPAETPRDARPGLLAIVRIPATRLRPDDLIVELHGTDADGRESERGRYFVRVKPAGRR